MNVNALAKEYAVEKWGKDYSYTMLPDDPLYARELRAIKEVEDIIRWLIPRLAELDQKGGAA